MVQFLFAVRAWLDSGSVCAARAVCNAMTCMIFCDLTSPCLRGRGSCALIWVYELGIRNEEATAGLNQLATNLLSRKVCPLLRALGINSSFGIR